MVELYIFDPTKLIYSDEESTITPFPLEFWEEIDDAGMAAPVPIIYLGSSTYIGQELT